jgi:hypothetical protein
MQVDWWWWCSVQCNITRALMVFWQGHRTESMSSDRLQTQRETHTDTERERERERGDYLSLSETAVEINVINSRCLVP